VAAGRTPFVHCTAHKAHTVDVVCFVYPPGRAQTPGQEVKPKYTIAANWLPKTHPSYLSCAARRVQPATRDSQSRRRIRQAPGCPGTTWLHAPHVTSILNFCSIVQSGRQNMRADISMWSSLNSWARAASSAVDPACPGGHQRTQNGHKRAQTGTNGHRASGMHVTGWIAGVWPGMPGHSPARGPRTRAQHAHAQHTLPVLAAEAGSTRHSRPKAATTVCRPSQLMRLSHAILRMIPASASASAPPTPLRGLP
jgi:hypothetical protein